MFWQYFFCVCGCACNRLCVHEGLDVKNTFPRRFGAGLCFPEAAWHTPGGLFRTPEQERWCQGRQGTWPLAFGRREYGCVGRIAASVSVHGY